MSKTEAQGELQAILAPLNSRDVPPSKSWMFADFVERVYLPFYRRKWKWSTAMTNEYRMNHDLVAEFGRCTLGEFHRDQLQAFLDRKAAAGLSFSTVDHLRWDLKQALDMAVAEGFLLRNPAQLIFTPRECPRPTADSMTRRKVLKQGAGLPALVPASALGLGGAVPPGDRIAMAAIGVGKPWPPSTT
ncbi:MAG: hypothetical protein ACRD44_06480 [Bryobacteraceae bacterium]